MKSLTVGQLMRFVRLLIFVGLLIVIDRTPLNAERLVSYFHLGTAGAFTLAAVGILVLWEMSKMVLGLLLLLLGLLGVLSGSGNRSEVPRQKTNDR